LEVIAFVYHWPPGALDELTLDEVESWAESAVARLKSRGWE
jgi:hypothetical protein